MRNQTDTRRESGAAARCALYLRVSMIQQGDGQSLKTQKRQLLQYARARGNEVVDVYCDAGLSGKDMDRPELQRLIQDAEQRRFDVVVVWKVDRISRSLRDLLGLIETFRKEIGVKSAATMVVDPPVGLSPPPPPQEMVTVRVSIAMATVQ